MRRAICGLAAIFLAVPQLGASAAQPAAAQVKALEEEYSQAQAEYLKGLKAAKTEAAKKEAQKRAPDTQALARRFLRIAQESRSDPAGLDAYTWVIAHVYGSGMPANGVGPPEDLRGEALAALRRDFLTSDRLGAACAALRHSDSADEQAFLRDVLAKNPHAAVNGLAALALASGLDGQAGTVRRLRGSAETRADYEKFYGKPWVQQRLALDAGKLADEANRLFKEAAEKYADRIDKEELVRQCQSLAYSRSRGAEAFLRHIAAQGAEREARAVACLALANQRKERAENAREVRTADAERLRRFQDSFGEDGVRELREADPAELTAESIELYQRVVEKYGDIKDTRGRLYADRAKAALFEIDFLAVGKAAPEITGEDLDAKPFNLSDYRGKVVLLDFWGHW